MVLKMASDIDPKQVWDGLKTWYLGVDSVRTTPRATLKNELEGFLMKKGETVNDL